MDSNDKILLSGALGILGVVGAYYSKDKTVKRGFAALAVGGAGFAAYSALSPSSPSSAQLPADRNDIPVLSSSSSLRSGSRFKADLSGTLISRNPAVLAPGAEFVALGDVDQSGVHQGFEAFVHARSIATGEEVDVPVSRIRG